MYCVYCVQILRGFPVSWSSFLSSYHFVCINMILCGCIHIHRHTPELQSLSIWSLHIWFGADPSWHLHLTGAALLCCSFFKTKTRREWWGMHRLESRRLSALREQTQRQKMVTQQGRWIPSFFSLLQGGY